MGVTKRLPPGRYYVGDPSHALSEADYAALMAQMYRKRQAVKMQGYFPIPGHGTGVTLAGTGGDGCFEDNRGNLYKVDAGMLGLTPESLVDPKQRVGRNGRGGQMGHLETFAGPITFSGAAGRIRITSGGKTTTITREVFGSPAAERPVSTSSPVTSRSRVRRSPSRSAADTRIGVTMKGNDGSPWTVRATKTGVHRWVKRAVAKRKR